MSCGAKNDLPNGYMLEGREFWIEFDPTHVSTSTVQNIMIDIKGKAERLCDAYNAGDDKGVQDALKEIEKEVAFTYDVLSTGYLDEVPESLYIVEDNLFDKRPVMFPSKNAFETWYASNYNRESNPPAEDIVGFTIFLIVDGRGGNISEMWSDPDEYLLYGDEAGERWFKPTVHDAFDADDFGAIYADEIDTYDAIKLCISAIESHDEMRRLPGKADRGFYAGLVEREGIALEFVPEGLRDLSMCVTALQDDEGAWPHVPAFIRDGAESAEEFLSRASD
ncbi:MAG: hypothetical protein K6F46_11460 [Desulfovibrio sp.]|nr:hypothetical protein [Desulfovibrio sp.]